ncbi:MAG TPA: hypothetical protein VGF74_20780 [Thermoleophilaceae bacterium]
MSHPATSRPDGDYWAGYRFTPRLIASAESAVWVVESHLPLIARIDPRTRAVHGPRPAGRGDAAGRGAHDLLAHGDSVWIRWNDGITRYDPEADDERWVDLSAAGLASGDAGVWALTGDGRLARVDPEGSGFELLGGPEVRRHSIAVGHGAVWALTWTHVPGGSTLARIDPATGDALGQLQLEGSPRQVIVDADSVYVRVWQRDSRDRVEELLVGVDPRTVKAVSELRLSPAGAGGAMLDGVLWAPDTDPYEHEQRGAPSSIRRIDAHTGDLLGGVEAPGWITAMSAGSAGVWGCLERRGRHNAVIELTPSETRTVELSDLEVADHLPDSR